MKSTTRYILVILGVWILSGCEKGAEAERSESSRSIAGGVFTSVDYKGDLEFKDGSVFLSGWGKEEAKLLGTLNISESGVVDYTPSRTLFLGHSNLGRGAGGEWVLQTPSRSFKFLPQSAETESVKGAYLADQAALYSLSGVDSARIVATLEDLKHFVVSRYLNKISDEDIVMMLMPEAFHIEDAFEKRDFIEKNAPVARDRVDSWKSVDLVVISRPSEAWDYMYSGGFGLLGKYDFDLSGWKIHGGPCGGMYSRREMKIGVMEVSVSYRAWPEDKCVLRADGEIARRIESERAQYSLGSTGSIYLRGRSEDGKLGLYSVRADFSLLGRDGEKIGDFTIDF